MFKWFVLSESLSDATIVNDYEKIYVKVQKHDDPKYPEFWHLFKLTTPATEIDEVVKTISEYMKDEWYAHFWNKDKVCIIFQRKIFWIPRENQWSSDEYREVVNYAVKNGVDKKYLDFKLED